MEIKKNKISVNKYLKSFSVPVLSETETIVPDNKPDLLKVTDISAELKTFNKSTDSGTASAGGSIYYTIIYIPEGANGISVINASSVFNHSEDIENIGNEASVSISPVIEHIEFNILNSRKISVKAIIGLNFSVTDKTDMSLTDNIDIDDAEISRISLKLLNRTVQKNHSINISEQLSLAPEKPSIASIIKSNAEIMRKDIRVISNKAIVKGDLTIHTLYLSDDSSLNVSEGTLPFTEILDAEGINEESLTHIDLSISDFNLSAVGDSNGDMRLLSVNLNIKAEIFGDEANTYETVNDAYSTSHKLSLDISKEEVDEFCERICVKNTLKETFSPEDNKISDIYSVSAVPSSVTAAEYDGGKTVVKGDMNVSILYITKNPDMPLVNIKTEIPFEINMQANDSYTNTSPKVTADNVCYNFSDSGIEIKIDISAELMCFRRRSVNIINSITEEPFADSRIPSIVLYFVQKNDTLWDIAKRYHTKSSYIEDLNGLNGELTVGSQLLIPKS